MLSNFLNICNGSKSKSHVVTRIPIWNGDGKDVFTLEQWLARIEKARVAANWNDADLMSFIYYSLGGEALLWYDVLKRSGIEDTYDAFKVTFLTL